MVGTALLLCVALMAQDERPGPEPSIPGRRRLSGTISSVNPSKSFSVKLDAGLYRITYFSQTAPAVIQVSADGVSLGSSAPTQPFTTVMRIVNGRFERTVDLPAAGLCTSDVAMEGNCADESFTSF